jgi:hypothetical protein
MNKTDIEILKEDIIEMGYRIIQSDKLVMQLHDTNLKNHYQQQILYLIDSYHDLENLLKESVEDYVEFEKQHGNLIDFTIRKLQKDLKK